MMNKVDPKPPIFAKMLRGSQGKGCFVLPDAVNGRMFLQSMESAGQPIILMRHLNKNIDPKKEQREDHRIWIFGAETDNPKFSAMRRISVSDDPRTNWSINKKAEPYEVGKDDIEGQMCVKIARAVGAGVLAVDTMWDEDQTRHFLIEINSCPGIGIRDIVDSDKDPVKLTVQYVLENYKRAKNANKKFWEGISINAMGVMTPVNPIDVKNFAKKYPHFFNVLKNAKL